MRPVLLRLIIGTVCILFAACSSDSESPTGYRFVDFAPIDLAGTESLSNLWPDDQAALWATLAASAEWRVSTTAPSDECARGAVRRRNIDAGWRTTQSGFVSDFDVGGQSKTRVVIRPTCQSTPWEPQDWVDWHIVAGAGETNATLRMMRNTDLTEPGLATFFTLQGSQISLDIYERSPDPKRTFTQHALREVANLVTAAIKRSSSGAVIARQLLVPGSVLSASGADMIIADTAEPGVYVVSGHVNAGVQGWITLSVTDERTGRSIVDDTSLRDSYEEVGWSSDTKEQFFFQAEVALALGDWPRSYPAHFELWFHPADGSVPKLMRKASKLVYAPSR